MSIPTEPIGSIPRPAELIAAFADRQTGGISAEAFDVVAERALRIPSGASNRQAPVVTGGEQTKPSFVTYPFLADLVDLLSIA
jgi:5-methyltetrahydropteroyltriglutamate--homocysteine methyltransferase